MKSIYYLSIVSILKIQINTLLSKLNNNVNFLIPPLRLGGLILVLLISTSTNAQSLIAVQDGSNATYYASLDSAITYAAAGSSIYIPGGSFTISKSINKELHIIGVGHNPDSCAITGISEVIGNILILNGSDHGSITGLKITGTFSFGTSPYTNVSINYYDIERCNIGGRICLATNSSHILINECIILETIQGNNTQLFQLSKCIVETGYLTYFSSNAYFINNIFLANDNYNGNYSPSSNHYFWVNINDCNFRNNIFLTPIRKDSGSSTASNNQFQNNLFNVGNFLSASPVNFFQNNITGPVSTLFVNQSGYYFDYKQDYHILPGSPAHNAGTDGTDLGIYGTGNPWKEGSLPANPHIQSSSISTVNGNLNVKIKVAAQDN